VKEPKLNNYEVEIHTGAGMGITTEEKERVIIGGHDISHLVNGIEYHGTPMNHQLTIRFTKAAKVKIFGSVAVTAYGDTGVSRATAVVEKDGNKKIPLKRIIIEGSEKE
jgi:hypothetical protein